LFSDPERKRDWLLEEVLEEGLPETVRVAAASLLRASVLHSGFTPPHDGAAEDTRTERLDRMEEASLVVAEMGGTFRPRFRTRVSYSS